MVKLVQLVFVFLSSLLHLLQAVAVWFGSSKGFKWSEAEAAAEGLLRGAGPIK